MAEPGSIEIDRSGPEVVVRLVQPQDSFTVTQLRMYAEYLATVAAEAVKPPPEPDVEAIVTAFKGTEARYLGYDDALPVLARAVLAAGYKCEPEVQPRDPATDPSPLGVRLRQERERRGWTLREAERRTGVPNAHISQLETGAIKSPELATLAPLAAAYGFSLDDMAGPS